MNSIIPTLQKIGTGVAIAGIILSTGACSLPASYQSHTPQAWRPGSTSPDAPGPNHPQAATHPQHQIISSLMGNGRTLRLDRCTKHALSENLDVQFSHVKARSAHAEMDVAKAAFDPEIEIGATQFSGGGGNTDFIASIKKRFVTGTEISVDGGTLFYDRGTRTDGTRTSDVEFEASIRQPLLRGFGPKINRAGIEHARIVGAAADAARQAEIYEMLRASESAYWTAAYARELLEAQRAGLGRTEQLVAEIGAKHAEGEASKIDLLEAEAARSAARDAVVRARKRYLDVTGLLWSLLGIQKYSTAEGISFAPLSVDLSPNALDPETHFRRAMKNSPTVIMLGNEVERQSLRRFVAGNQLLPELDLEFNYGSNDPFSFSSSDPDVSSVGGNWSALLTLSIPWTFRAERANVRIAQAELEGSKIKREKGLRELRRLCHETCREIGSAKEQQQAAFNALRVNKAKWDEQRSLHGEGFATARDLTEAEAELRMAEARELEARLRIILAEAMLARLDGTIAHRHGIIL